MRLPPRHPLLWWHQRPSHLLPERSGAARTPVSDCVFVPHNLSVEKSEMSIDLPGPETIVELCSEADRTVFSCSEGSTTGVKDPDLYERQEAACAQLEEELRGEPWLNPNYQHLFQGTCLALGGPLSCQRLTPPAPSSPASGTPSSTQEAPQPLLPRRGPPSHVQAQGPPSHVQARGPRSHTHDCPVTGHFLGRQLGIIAVLYGLLNCTAAAFCTAGLLIGDGAAC